MGSIYSSAFIILCNSMHILITEPSYFLSVAKLNFYVFAPKIIQNAKAFCADVFLCVKQDNVKSYQHRYQHLNSRVHIFADF